MSVASPWREAESFRAVEHGDFVEVKLIGDRLPEELGEALIAAASARGWCRLILDCSNVRFLTSLGLGALIRLDRQLRPAGGRLRIVGLKDDLRELFEITRIDRVVQLFGDRDAAVTRGW
ncbi:STAS domain-containing protein [Tautonia sociabilis]|uniref:Anti-sigma factor antagonist n=1 Tax=Tautonia sociabilis TaxID=2080755 RepID=A0A432MKD6_9BACT|nr:STAS domain-containing protein [Tautonia sociabilis]RUL87709.1 anti-sigma factor antagonist [Tautonia sociabilis]